MGAALLLADGETLRPYVATAASRALRLDVEIGALALGKGRLLSIEAQDVVVRNPAWAEGDAARIGSLSLDVDIVSLLWGPTRISRLVVERAEVDLAVSAEHGVNWSPSAPTLEALLPDDRPEVPEIADAILRELTVTLRDIDASTARSLEIATATGAARGGEDVRLDGEGTLDGRAATFALTGDGYETLVAAVDPYGFSIGVEGEIALTVEGVLGPGADFEIVGATLDASGPDMSLLTPTIGAPFPATPPFDIAAEIRREGTTLGLRQIAGTFGDSDIAGWVSVDTASDRPRVTGALSSRRLDFDDLAGLVGAAPDPDETISAEQREKAAEAGLLPDEQPPVAALRRVDADLTFEAASVSAPIAHVEALSARVILDDGRLVVSQVSLSVAGGTAQGEAALNVREPAPSADLALAFEGVDIKPYFAGTGLVQEMAGPLSGRLYLLGVGETLAEMLANARGGGHVIMRDGSISGLLVEAIGLDVTEALGLLIFEDVAVPIACAAAAFTVEGSAYRIVHAVASTSDSTLLARGVVDLGAQTLDIEIEARAKDFSLIDYNAPVSVSGPITDPRVTIAGLDPLPFFELGDERSPGCDAIIAEARRAGPGTP